MYIMIEKEKQEFERLIKIMIILIHENYLNDNIVQEKEFLEYLFYHKKKDCFANFISFCHAVGIEYNFKFIYDKDIIKCYCKKRTYPFLCITILEAQKFAETLKRNTPHLYDMIWLQWNDKRINKIIGK